MTTLVCFQAGGTTYGIPVTSTLGVRRAREVVNVPADGTDIVGVLPGDPLLSVIAPLTVDDAAHVLVVTTPGRDFGLLVDAVTDVVTVDDTAVQPSQDPGLIVGVTQRPDGIVLITDPLALGGRP